MAIEFTPSAPIWEVGTEQYFSDYRRQVEEQLRPVVEDDEEPEAKIQVLTEALIIPIGEMPTKMASIYKEALALGFTLYPRRSTFHKEAVYFLKSSTTNQAGSLRYAAKDMRFYGLTGVYPGSMLGFELYWEGMGEGKTAGFLHARAFDPLGIPTENWIDYSIGERDRKAMSLTRAKADELAQKRDEQLNDGTSRLQKYISFVSVADFNLWLEDWKAILGGDSTSA